MRQVFFIILSMYVFLDIFFLLFHSGLILFNLFGWLWKKTMRLNLFTLLATAFSWIVLGIWYGFGYCPCTHWHWQVRRELGYIGMPNSYIKFLVDELLGIQVSVGVVDYVTGIAFILALAFSLQRNFNRGFFKEEKIIT